MSVQIRFRGTKEGNFSAYLDVYSTGRRTYVYPEIYVSKDYTGLKNYAKQDKDSMELVQRIRDKINLEIKEQQFNFVPASVRNQDFVLYFEKLATNEKKQQRGYKQVLKHLKGFSATKGGKLPFSTVNQNLCREFINFLRRIGTTDDKKPVSENSLCLYMRYLNVVMKKAVDEKILKNNPLKELPREMKPKQRQSQREYLTIEELRQLNSTPFPNDNVQVKQAFLLGCFTGLRVSDLMQLKHNDIEDGVIKYRQKKSEKEFHHLPLNETAKQILSEVTPPQGRDQVFWKVKRNITTDANLKLWAANAGIKKRVTWHVSRHSFSVLFLNNGGDIYTLKELLGHSSVTVTEIYAKIANPTKVKLINNLPNL